MSDIDVMDRIFEALCGVEDTDLFVSRIGRQVFVEADGVEYALVLAKALPSPPVDKR